MVTIWLSPDLRDPEQSIRLLPGVISCKIREIPVLTRVVFSSRGLRTARPTVWKRWPATRDDALAFAASWDHVLKAEELAVSLARERGLLRSPLPRLRWRMLRTASELAGYRIHFPMRWLGFNARERELVRTGFLYGGVSRGHFVDMMSPPLAAVYPYKTGR